MQSLQKLVWETFSVPFFIALWSSHRKKNTVAWPSAIVFLTWQDGQPAISAWCARAEGLLGTSKIMGRLAEILRAWASCSVAVRVFSPWCSHPTTAEQQPESSSLLSSGVTATQLFLSGCQVPAPELLLSERALRMVHALRGWGGEGGLRQAPTSSTEAERSHWGGVQDWISAFQTSVVSQVFSWHRSYWHQCANADLHPLMNMRLGEQGDRVIL